MRGPYWEERIGTEEGVINSVITFHDYCFCASDINVTLHFNSAQHSLLMYFHLYCFIICIYLQTARAPVKRTLNVSTSMYDFKLIIAILWFTKFDMEYCTTCM